MILNVHQELTFIFQILKVLRGNKLDFLSSWKKKKKEHLKHNCSFYPVSSCSTSLWIFFFVQVMSKETIFLFAIKLKRKVFKAPGDKTTLSRDIDSNQNNNSSFSSKKSQM